MLEPVISRFGDLYLLYVEVTFGLWLPTLVDKATLLDITSLLIVSDKILLRSKFEFCFETGLELVILEVFVVMDYSNGGELDLDRLLSKLI